MWKNRIGTYNTTNYRPLTGWKLPADKLRQRFSLPAVKTLAVRTVEPPFKQLRLNTQRLKAWSGNRIDAWRREQLRRLQRSNSSGAWPLIGEELTIFLTLLFFFSFFWLPILCLTDFHLNLSFDSIDSLQGKLQRKTLYFNKGCVSFVNECDSVTGVDTERDIQRKEVGAGVLLCRQNFKK